MSCRSSTEETAGVVSPAIRVARLIEGACSERECLHAVEWSRGRHRPRLADEDRQCVPDAKGAEQIAAPARNTVIDGGRARTPEPWTHVLPRRIRPVLSDDVDRCCRR